MKRAVLSLSAIFLLPLSNPAIAAESVQVENSAANPQIDYAGFTQLTEKLAGYRQSRLVQMDSFIAKAKQENAIILDTRSAAAYKNGHIDGAINLPFSDFTEAKLEQIIGDKSRPVLIYCNNNFRDNIPPIVLKLAPLALNIPTFINLYGYGYENIYELAGVTHIADPRVKWTGAIAPPLGLRAFPSVNAASAGEQPAS
ncbi:MAG: rhodanese-like domain-containing protein [Parasphingorhabdus sp.]|uniref:rhodanese-like domain-containing protein n=1 Tax=Parasphingorhabdus sp. TaxID=2709688 RepID=UPI003297CECD